MPDAWYYLTDSDEEEVVGPVSLARLVEFIQRGELREDALISSDLEEWRHADVVAEVMAILPVDRARIVREYLGYAAAPIGEEDWGWASDKLGRIITYVPDLAWEIVTALIDAAPSEDALAFFAAGPLEDLLSDHGAKVIDSVEARARVDAKFLKAVRQLRRLQMTDEVWARVEKAAGRFGA